MQHVAVKPIGELAEVLPGLSTGTRLEHTPAGTHQVVQSRHLMAGLPYCYTAADEFRITPGREAGRYEVHAGDILFMSRGSRNVASWIESIPEPTVAPVSFYILRPKAGVNAGYLTWFLNQPGAQRSIGDIRTGAGTPIVQRAPFTQMLVPLPDIETQRTIAGIGAAMAQERETLLRLATTTARLHEATAEHIARSLFERSENHDGE